MNHGLYSGPLAYNSILNSLHTVSEFYLDLINPLTIQLQYLELFSLFLLMVWYPEDSKKQIILDGTLNCFRKLMRLLTSFTSWILGFSNTDIIDSLLDDIVVDLLLGSGGERHINITFSFLTLFSFREIVSLTYRRDENQLVWANNSYSSWMWLLIVGCPWP